VRIFLFELTGYKISDGFSGSLCVQSYLWKTGWLTMPFLMIDLSKTFDQQVFPLDRSIPYDLNHKRKTHKSSAKSRTWIIFKRLPK
jgi:hypothetical protein